MRIGHAWPIEDSVARTSRIDAEREGISMFDQDTTLSADKALEYRLPSAVTPDRYDLTLTPDLSAFTFTGEEWVAIKVHQATSEVVLNALELEIDSAAAERGGKSLTGRIELEPARERAHLHFSETLEAGDWKLHIKFRGILNDKLHGFYRSQYVDSAGKSHVAATTQFESTDARRAIPCWDEPALKSVFKVTLVIDENLTAISNAGVERERKLGNGKKEVVFKDTIRMSTYLLAFIVGEFDATAPVDAGTPLRVAHVPGKQALAGWAQQIGAFSLKFFANYYGIPYPGDKLDLIAIPDFAAGAMENLGAITFRETALLADDKTASRAELERIADVVSHENAHMWFGDLVTMRWWNGIWLNEAFATFMEMLAVDAWKPNWKRWESFSVSRAAAMAIDALKSTRSIEYTTSDPVRTLMDSWIFQQGFPVVSVAAANGGRALKISQRRFFYAPPENPEPQLYHVPIMIRVRTEKGVAAQKLLLTDGETTLDLAGPVEWALLNEGAHGFYRVRYSPELLQALTQNLKELKPVERFGLVSDTWAATVAGLTPLAEFVKMARLFRDETDLNVWRALLGAFNYLDIIVSDAQRPSLARAVRETVGPAAARLGWTPKPGEDELQGQLRATLTGALGTLGDDPEVQSRARELYATWQRDPSQDDRDLLPAFINIAAYTGDAARYQEFKKNFKSARTPQEEQRYLFSLAGFRVPEALRQTMEMTLNGEVRTQNSPFLMHALLYNPTCRYEAWEFVKRNWETMVSKFPDSSMPRMCEAIVGLLDHQAEVNTFFEQHKPRLGSKLIDQHLERLSVAVEFRNREGAKLEATLKG